jgi:hypothetical protein
MTPAAKRYLEGELHWEAELRRKAGRQGVKRRTDRRGRRELARVRDRRDVREAKIGLAHRAYIDGSDAEPLAGYTQEKVDALGHKGQALWINGRYAWPVVRRRDLFNLLAAWRQLPPGKEASEVKAWLKSRAIGLGLEAELPASWLPSVPAPVGPRS